MVRHPARSRPRLKSGQWPLQEMQRYAGTATIQGKLGQHAILMSFCSKFVLLISGLLYVAKASSPSELLIEAKGLGSWLKDTRRHLHQWPETLYQVTHASNLSQMYTCTKPIAAEE